MNRLIKGIITWYNSIGWFRNEAEAKSVLVPEVVERTRLREDQYLALERKMIQPVVSSNTTELQAGYALGVQTVLKELRDGFVARS